MPRRGGCSNLAIVGGIALAIGFAAAGVYMDRAGRGDFAGFPSWWKVVVEISMVLTALATGGAAWAAARAARSAHEGVALASLTAERQLRAYLAFVSIEITNVSPGQKPKVQIFVKNVGATPAHDVRIYHTFLLFQHPQLPEWVEIDLPKYRTNSGTLTPQMRTRMDPEVKFDLSAEDIEAIRDGNKAFYIVASAWYRDAFGKWCRLVHWAMYNKWNISSGKSGAHICPYGNIYEYDIGEDA